MIGPNATSPWLAYYGDDFTGSTDALESLATRGIRTVLFTDPPTPEELQQYPGLQAFGIAGQTRAMSPTQMGDTLRAAFTAIRACGPRFVHYKTCSTFDSSPDVGSVGRAIDIAIESLGVRHVPVFVAAPDLGRYCAFGNLFARFGVEAEAFRLDRHPSMSRHPITPMAEADLRRHLSLQTVRSIGLLDLPHLEMDAHQRLAQLRELQRIHDIVLIDGCNAAHVSTVGDVLVDIASTAAAPTAFAVGSSGIESALCARWQRDGLCSGKAHFDVVAEAGPLLVVCGSCSPVTAQQIAHARTHGFVELAFNGAALADPSEGLSDLVDGAARALSAGKSVIVHSSGTAAVKPGRLAIDHTAARSIGRRLGGATYRILERTRVRRVVVAGGDTSSEIARVLGIRSVEMVGPLTRGSPLCRASAPASPANELEFTFKGGQIGPPDFFSQVERGLASIVT